MENEIIKSKCLICGKEIDAEVGIKNGGNSFPLNLCNSNLCNSIAKLSLKLCEKNNELEAIYQSYNSYALNEGNMEKINTEMNKVNDIIDDIIKEEDLEFSENELIILKYYVPKYSLSLEALKTIHNSI